MQALAVHPSCALTQLRSPPKPHDDEAGFEVCRVGQGRESEQVDWNTCSLDRVVNHYELCVMSSLVRLVKHQLRHRIAITRHFIPNRVQLLQLPVAQLDL